MCVCACMRASLPPYQTTSTLFSAQYHHFNAQYHRSVHSTTTSMHSNTTQCTVPPLSAQYHHFNAQYHCSVHSTTTSMHSTTTQCTVPPLQCTVPPLQCTVPPLPSQSVMHIFLAYSYFFQHVESVALVLMTQCHIPEDLVFTSITVGTSNLTKNLPFPFRLCMCTN